MYAAYLIISSVLLCIGYLCYKWVLANERQHSANRVALYFIYICALTLPLIILSFPESSDAIPSAHTGIEIGMPFTVGIDHPADETLNSNILSILFRIIAGVYIIGVLFIIGRTVYGMTILSRLIRKGKKMTEQSAEGFDLVLLKEQGVAPFSWMKYIVMSEEDYDNFGEMIIRHEASHLRLRHWIDLLLAQFVIAFQWFNPAAWLMREEFQTVHEFQADENALAETLDMKEYQRMLIKKAVGTRFQSLANSLNHSKLKKRLAMMYKEKSSGVRRLSALLLIPAMAAGCALFEVPAVAAAINSTTRLADRVFERKVNQNPAESEVVAEISLRKSEPSVESRVETPSMPMIETPTSASESARVIDSDSGIDTPAPTPSSNEMPAEESVPAEDKEVYVAVEQSAEFPGGMAGLMKYLASQIKYPEEAKEKNEEGRVVVKFIVEANGSVRDAKVIKGVSPSLDAEAVRVVSTMPDWQPAKINGKPVSSYFNIPVSFKLTKNESAKTDNE